VRDFNRQSDRRQSEQCTHHNALATRRKRPAKYVSQRISGQQFGLKEDHARIPDCRCSAQLGQDQSTDERLQAEEQKRASKGREGEEKGQGNIPKEDQRVADRL
jgi:hypothetical protein